MASVRSTTECTASVAAAINAQLFEHVLHSVSAILTCAKTSGGAYLTSNSAMYNSCSVRL
jgi:hypothetical protein